VPVHDSPWGATINRRKKEGLLDNIPVEVYFGYDIVQIGFDFTPRFPVKTLEKTIPILWQKLPQR